MKSFKIYSNQNLIMKIQKQITQRLFSNISFINDHIIVMNETDRTIVGLLWHENIMIS